MARDPISFVAQVETVNFEVSLSTWHLSRPLLKFALEFGGLPEDHDPPLDSHPI